MKFRKSVFKLFFCALLSIFTIAIAEANPINKELPAIAPIVVSISAGGPVTFCKGGYLGELPPPATDSITPYNSTGGYIDTCNTLTILLTAQGTSASTAGATFQWYVMDNNGNWIAITNATNATFSANNSDITDGSNNHHSYKCIITINGNSITLNIVKINFRNPPDFTPTPATSSLCSGSSILLDANPNTNLTNQTFSWSPASSLSSSTGEIVTASPTTTTTYTIIGTRFGCTLTKTITVNVTASPAPPTVTSPLVYCQNTTAAQLTATAAAGYTLNWYTTPIFGNSTTTAPTPSTTVAGNFTYYVSQSINSNVCPSPRVPIVVTVNPRPNVILTANPSNLRICRGDTAILTASGGGTYIWSANLGSVTTNPVRVSPTNNTTYSVSSTNSFGCIGSAQVTIVVDAIPVALFTTDIQGNCPKRKKVEFQNQSTGNNLQFSWNFGDPTSSNNTSSQQNPTHTFSFDNQSYVVTLTVTSNNGSGCSATYSQTISLGSVPNASLFDVINDPPFKLCAAGSFDITVANSSTTITTNQNYNINWGDSTSYSGATFDTITHSYPALGFFEIILTVTSNSGCIDTAHYTVYIGTNPSVGLATPGSTILQCVPAVDSFFVTNTSNNPPGTIYTVSFNDGSPNLTFNHPPPTAFTHTFTTSSCGAIGGVTPNTFYVRIKAQNPCGFSNGTVEPITTVIKPKANFTIAPSTVVCTGQIVTFTDSSISGSVVDNNGVCDTSRYRFWSILPNTGYSIISGLLGTPAPPSPNISGSSSVNVSFTIPGTYTIKLIIKSVSNAASACRSDTITKTICIQDPPIPSFTANQLVGCSPLVVTINNSSTPAVYCGPTTRLWKVTHTPGICIQDSSVNYLYTSGTDSTSMNPVIQFNNQGTYYVTLTLKNACPLVTSPSTIITVKRKPQVTLSSPPSICVGQSIAPTISPLSCGGTNTLYAWGFSGGTPNNYLSSTTPNPGTIQYNFPGNYVITDTVTNECGTAINTASLIVNPLPISIAGPDSVICSGGSISIGAPAVFGNTYSWSPTTGLSSSTNSNPTVTLNNSTASNSVHTYILTVTNSNGCTDKDTVDVTVKPLPPVAVSASSNSICVGGSTILTASGADTYSWSPSTALSAITGTTVTASPTSTITYTITGTNTITGCIKGVPITVTVNPLPVFPTVTSNIGYCQGSTVSALTASTTSAGNTLLWYTTATGAVGSSTAPIPSTVVLGSTTYYVSQVVTATGCEGNRSSITVTISPNPIAPIATTPVVYCQGATSSALSATALSGNTLYWYTAATGGTGTITAPTPSTATATTLTYYVGQTTTATSCQSPRTMITVTINPKPVAPIVSTPVIYCQYATAAPLTATAAIGNTLLWYSASTGGTGTAIDPTPITTIVGNTNYYVSQIVTLTGCESPRALIVVTVKSTPVIAGTYVNPSACSSPTGSINITGLITSNSYALNYSVNGVPHTPAITITGQTNYTLSSLTSGTYSNIYVTLSGCPSNTLAYTLTPPFPPTTPTASADTTICSGSNLSLSVTSAATTPTYTWTGPNYTGSGATINIPNATTAYTGYFYVTVTSSNCTSLRDSVYATVNPLPIAPIVTNPVSYCQGDIAVSLIASALIGNTLNWYNLPTGGTSSTLVPIPVTNNVGNTSYYVSQFNSTTNCEGPRVPIVVTINPKPIIPDTIRTICSGQPFTVSPVSYLPNIVVPANTTYTWVVSPNSNVTGSGNQITGVTVISQTLVNTTNTQQTVVYTVTPTSGSAGNCVGQIFTISVIVKPKPNARDTTFSICSSSSFIINPVNTSTQIIPSGTLYTWSISTNAQLNGQSGQSTPSAQVNQTLTSNSNIPQAIVYTVIPVSGACSGNSFLINITVNPAPKLNDTSRVICSGGTFIVSPVNSPSTQQIVPLGTIYTWTASSSANITGWANQSIPQSTISQTLVNLTNVRDSVLYTVIPRSILGDSCFGPSFKIKVYVDPMPKIMDATSTICSGSTFIISPSNNQPTQIVPLNTTYTWLATTNTNITGQSAQNTGQSSISQTLTNLTNVTDSVIYTVIPKSPANCSGAPFLIKVYVNPKPVIANQTIAICGDSSFSFTPSNGNPTAGTIIPLNTTFTWTISANPNLSGQNAQSIAHTSIADTLVNNTNLVQTIIYSVVPLSGYSGLCPGDTFKITVTVNPRPKINDTTRVICSGTSFTASPVNNILAGQIVPAGTTYSWVAPQLTTGLIGGAAGNGPSVIGTLSNLTDNVQTAVYTVVAAGGIAVGSCTRDTFLVTVSVNPAPHVTFIPASQSICSGTATAVVHIISPTIGVSIPWNSMQPIPTGLSGMLQSGNDSIPSQTLVNITNAPIVFVDSAQAITTGSTACPGTKTPYFITINPAPKLNDTTRTICSGGNFIVSPLNAPLSQQVVPTGTIYTWTATSTANITGWSNQVVPQSTISQILVNLTNVRDSVLYTVIPRSILADSCFGPSFKVKVYVDPTPKINDTTIKVCSRNTFTYSAVNYQPNQIVPSNTMYTWTILTPNSNISGAGPQTIYTSSVSETLTNLTNLPQVIQYLVVPKSGICPGQPFVLTVTVNPTPVILPQILNFCSEDGFTYSPVNNPITTIVPINTIYTWTITTTNNNITGQYAQSIPQANISQVQLVNHTNVDQQLVYTVTPVSGAVGNCLGAPFTITVTVNPKPNIRDTLISVCSGQSFSVTPAQTIAGNIIPAGTTYSWSVPVMHADLSGGVSGNNSSVNGILSNSSDSIRTAVYTVIPTSGYNGSCVGDSFHVTVHVNPAPRIIFTPSPQNICSGTAPSSVTINSPTPNVLIPWSTVNPPITVLGYDNNGNTTIPAHILTNLTNIPVIINYSATASTTVGVACPGMPVPYTITVNPTPKIHDTAFVICSGTSFGLTPVNNQPYNIVPINTTYTWNVVVNNNVVGQSNQQTPQTVISQILTNITNTVQTVQYNVTPVSGDSGHCMGNSFIINVTVNPTPVIPALYDTICSASSFSQTPVNSLPNALTIVPSGTTYSWPAPLLPIGMSGGASGTNQTSISGNLTNTTFAPITITYVVTPRSGASGNCVGNPFNVFITVNPLASISNNPLSQSVCNGNTTTPVSWSSYTSGSAYSWTIISSGNVTGYLPAGNGPILGSMTLTNTGIAQDSVVYAVSSTASACAGPATNYTIYINPDAKANFTSPYDTACWPYAIVINNTSPLSPGNANIPNGSYNWYTIGSTGNSNYIGIGSAFPGYTIPGPSDSIKIKLVAISAFGCKNDSLTYTFYTKPKPAASFAMSNRDSCGPLTVSFTNQTNLIDTFRYQWNFGNGQTSTLTNPTPVTFLNNPRFYDTTYYITMHAFNECDTTTYVDSVIVRANPKARFFVSSTSGCSPFTIQITNTSLGNSYEYYWDFGNGVRDTTYSNGTLSYIYYTGVVDTFNLMLIAQNQCGRDTQIINIRVAPNTIIPGVSINATELYGCVAHTVNFINSTSGATSFTWDFGDATPTLVTSVFQNIVQHIYNTPGTFIVNIDMTNGCSDTSVIKQVIVYPRPIAAFNSNQILYCSGDTVHLSNTSQNSNSYLWSWGTGASTSGFQPPHIFSTAGTYTISLQAQVTAPTGLVCYDTVSHFVTILNKPDSTINSNISSANCAPFILTASMPGIINETVTWYVYDTTVAGYPIVQNGPSLQYTFNNPGTFTIHMIAENAAGCKDSAIRTFTVYQKPNAGFTPLNLMTCSLDTLVGYTNTTTANNYTPLTYKWYVDNIQMSTSGNFNYRYTTLPAVPLPRIFVTKLVAMNIVGCADSVSGTLQMNPTAKSLFSITNPNSCIPFVANFTDNSTYATNYSWYVNGVFFTNGANPIINITSANTNYTITLIVSNSYACRPDTSTVTFRTSVMPKAIFSLNNTLGCTGQLNVITTNSSQNANAYDWEWGDGTSNSIQTNPTHLFTSIGTYRIALTAKDGVCTDTTSRVVIVARKPAVNFMVSNVKNCDTATIRIINITTNADSFLWVLSNGMTSTAQSPIFTLLPSNTPYTVQLIAYNQQGCRDSLTKPNYINVFPPPIADFYINPAATISIPDYTFSFTNLTLNSILYQYEWSLGDGTFANTRDVPDHLYPDTGSYPIRLVVLDTSTNCTDTAFKVVRIEGYPGYLYVPNAFYPNSIRTEFKSFKPVGKGIAEYELQIFDSWGKLLFRTTKLDANGSPVEGWDGTFKGKTMPQDAYAWYIKARFRNGIAWGGMQYNQRESGSQGHTFGTITLFR